MICYNFQVTYFFRINNVFELFALYRVVDQTFEVHTYLGKVTHIFNTENAYVNIQT